MTPLRTWISLVALLAAVILGGEPIPSATPAAGVFEITDVFVMPREAVLRERPSANARIVGIVAAGDRLQETAIAGAFLRVERPGTVDGAAESARSGFLSRDAASVFPAGPRGTADLASAGAALAATAAIRTLGVAMLERATRRLREQGTPDPALEVLLGESAEALLRQNGRWPSDVPRTFRPCRTGAGGRCAVYSGEAFTRALELASAPGAHGLEAIR